MADEHKYPYNYRGKVLDNSDPLKIGRIRCEVYPMLIGVETARQMRASNSRCTIEGIETSALPWAIAATPVFFGAGNGTGVFTVPDVDSMVWVFFEQGNINQPVYFAEAPDGANGLPTNRLTGYPERRVIKSSSGAIIFIDNSNGDIVITGANDVVVQGDNYVRINPLAKVE